MMPNLAFVIEDNEDIAQFFSRALTAEGFQVEIISNGERALSRLEEESPSFITLDIHLPDLNGVTILSYIRAKEHLKQTVVVIATADAALSDDFKYMVDLVLEKPITYSQMRDAVRQCKKN